MDTAHGARFPGQGGTVLAGSGGRAPGRALGETAPRRPGRLGPRRAFPQTGFLSRFLRLSEAGVPALPRGALTHRTQTGPCRRRAARPAGAHGRALLILPLPPPGDREHSSGLNLPAAPATLTGQLTARGRKHGVSRGRPPPPGTLSLFQLRGGRAAPAPSGRTSPRLCGRRVVV